MSKFGFVRLTRHTADPVDVVLIRLTTIDHVQSTPTGGSLVTGNGYAYEVLESCDAVLDLLNPVGTP